MRKKTQVIEPGKSSTVWWWAEASADLLRRSSLSWRPGKTCLILENHPIFGGEAKRNEFEVDGQRLMVHQGSAACFPPLASDPLAGFYESIGMDWSQFRYQERWKRLKRWIFKPRRMAWGANFGLLFRGKVWASGGRPGAGPLGNQAGGRAHLGAGQARTAGHA